MTDRHLRLILSAGESLPTSLSWMIGSGYVTLMTGDDEQNTTTLGIWGPGELVIPTLLACRNLELKALSAVQVTGRSATPEQEQHCIRQQMLQLSELLQLAQIRRAEQRLFHLLLWLGERFGQHSSQGLILSFSDLNLTHRNLAEITGMTRVTVTKALIRFRQEGRLCKQGGQELLRRE